MTKSGGGSSSDGSLGDDSLSSSSSSSGFEALEGSFQCNNERRPLTANPEHEVSFNFDCDDYGSTSTSDRNDRYVNINKKNKRYPPLTANNTLTTLDTSTHSALSYGSSASSRQRNLREMFKDFRQASTSSITQSVRQIQRAIAEHTGSIGMLGSLSIAINNLTGPGMLELPATFARSGIIPTAFTLVFVCCLSAFCSLHMANVISKVPQNKDFKQGVEFPEAFNTYWGHKWFIVANWLFFGCITVLNISSLVDNAQVLDTFMAHVNPWGGAWAWALDPIHMNVTIIHWDPSICSKRLLYEGGCVPFESSENEHEPNHFYLITAGYVTTAVLFFPLALMDLTENVAWQILGFFVLLVTSTQFIVTFATSELDFSHLSWWGDSWESLLGVVLFNFALVITVPAWLYEKEPHVDIPTVLHTSTIFSTFLYLSIGILGCLSMPDVSDNFLESIMSGALGPAMQIGASVFAFFIVGLNIPLFSILTRLSLMGGSNELRASYQGSQFCSRRVANLLAVYLPFGLSWIMYQGSKVTMLLSWGGMIFTSLVAFLLPLALALYVVETQFEEGLGSVQVYPWGLTEVWSSKEAQVRALQILLVLSSIAVVAALVGNIIAASNDDGV